MLKDWGDNAAHSEDLGSTYDFERQSLDALPVADLPRWVDGKMVLDRLLRTFQQAASLPTRSRLDWVNLYLDKCPTPPAEAVNLLGRILQAAATYP